MVPSLEYRMEKWRKVEKKQHTVAHSHLCFESDLLRFLYKCHYKGNIVRRKIQVVWFFQAKRSEKLLKCRSEKLKNLVLSSCMYVCVQITAFRKRMSVFLFILSFFVSLRFCVKLSSNRKWQWFDWHNMHHQHHHSIWTWSMKEIYKIINCMYIYMQSMCGNLVHDTNHYILFIAIGTKSQPIVHDEKRNKMLDSK